MKESIAFWTLKERERFDDQWVLGNGLLSSNLVGVPDLKRIYNLITVADFTYEPFLGTQLQIMGVGAIMGVVNGFTD